MDGADKMIPEYRAETINGDVVFGWLNYLPKDHKGIKKGYYISNKAGMPFAYNVSPSTLARYTGQKDKHEICIYGSFELNGKMTEGGDVVRSDVFDFNGSYLHETMDYNVVFEGGMWIMKSIDTNYDNNILHSIGSGLLEIIRKIK